MNVLVIAPHPDDEVLGCGATIKKLSEEGNTVFV
ncbi:MAG: PIG-L deacetylase family protein, partial [Bacteroidia bacterium]